MEKIEIKPAFKENNVAITLQSSDYFTPYTAVTIKSIIDHASDNYNYDIIVTSKDMSEENADKICGMANKEKNVSIRVINVREIYDSIVCVNDKRFGGETVTRIFLAELLLEYEKVINLDSDMIICEDLSNMYNIDISDYYIGAVNELQGYVSYHGKFNGTYFNDHTLNDILEIPNIKNYYNGGLFMMNLKKIREDFTAKQIADFIMFNKLKFYEQDAFSHFFVGKVYELDWAWNWQCDADGFFNKHIKEIYDVDNYSKKYNEAKKNPKIIHYLSTMKPWIDATSRKAGIWWSVACTTPFYNEIIARKCEKNEKTNKRLLFLCETYYQLINVINIKYHCYSEVDADIIITSSSDFNIYEEAIRNCKLFKKVIMTEYSYQKNGKDFGFNIKDRTNSIIHASEYSYSLEVLEDYSDFFIPVDQFMFYKVLYYQLVQRGIIPHIHIYEDGISTYIQEPLVNIKRDMVDHSIFSEEERFENNIIEIILYEPELYSGKSGKNLITSMPKIKKTDSQFCNILRNIFGCPDLPEEKYIFFDEGFILEKISSNEVDVLNRISEYIGKENIIIKLHPRMDANFYELHGYKTFTDVRIPWEIYVLLSNVADKVLLSISSAALIAPKLVFDMDMKAIYFAEIMKLSCRSHVKHENFRCFYAKVAALYNESQKQIFTPKLLQELDCCIRAVEGGV